MGLKEFRTANNLKQNELADYLGVNKGTLCNIEAGRRVLTKEMARRIEENDRGWDTTMLKTEKKTFENRYIPLVPIDAHAGWLGDYSEGIMPSQCETIMSPISGATCAIRISGNSMEPRYRSGDVALLQRINENIFIEWGKPYVLSTENGPILKIIRKTERDRIIECVSLNQNYQPFELDTKYIDGWYKVLGVISFE